MKKIISLLIFLILLSGCITEDCSECEICPEEEGEVFVIFNNVYLNEYNEDELIIIYNLFNFGYVESSNVNVRCYIENQEQKVLISKDKNEGNVASTSIKRGEVILKKPPIIEEEMYYYYCKIISCDNCEILSGRLQEY